MQKKPIARSSIEDCIKDCANTYEGKVLLYWLMNECGYNKNLIHESESRTAQLSAMRGIYAKLRKYIEPKDLIDIEILYTIEETKE